MHYYNFNIGDYHSHTSHLDHIEDIIYRRMMDFCYLNEMPLPKDVDEIARLIRMRGECERIAVVLRDFFDEQCDGYTQARITEEVEKYQAKSDKARKSARVRWAKNGDSSDANALQAQSEGNAKQETINNKHKPLNSKREKPKSEKTDFGVFDLDERYVEEIIRIRKKNDKGKTRGQISQRVANALAEEFKNAVKHGYTVERILTEWELAGWQSFKLEWLVNRIGQPNVEMHLPQQAVQQASTKTKDRTVQQQLDDNSWANY